MKYNEIKELTTAELAERLAEQGITIQVDEEALSMIAEVGYDPVYGARPLKRVIQQQLQNELAKELLGGEFAEGDCVTVEFHQDEFLFSKEKK